MRSRGGSATGLLAWLSTLVLGLWLFHTMGDGGLAAPPWQPAAFVDWVAATDPLLATMAALRVLVLGLAWYLVGVTTIGMFARLTRAARLVRLADAVTVPAVRRLLQSALGVSLATAMVGAATPARAEPLPLQVLETAADTVSTATEATDGGTPADDPTPGEGSGGPPGDGSGGPPSEGSGGPPPTDGDGGDAELPLVLRLMEQAQTDAATADPETRDAASADAQDHGRPEAATDDRATDDRDADDRETSPAGDEADDGAAGAAGEPSGTAPAGDRERRVVAGDSFWSIAVAHLTDVGGVAPTDAEVVPYWQRLVDDNRDRLADPQNPDLLFPGQVVVLPDAISTG